MNAEANLSVDLEGLCYARTVDTLSCYHAPLLHAARAWSSKQMFFVFKLQLD